MSGSKSTGENTLSYYEGVKNVVIGDIGGTINLHWWDYDKVDTECRRKEKADGSMRAFYIWPDVITQHESGRVRMQTYGWSFAKAYNKYGEMVPLCLECKPHFEGITIINKAKSTHLFTQRLVIV